MQALASKRIRGPQCRYEFNAHGYTQKPQKLNICAFVSFLLLFEGRPAFSTQSRGAGPRVDEHGGARLPHSTDISYNPVGSGRGQFHHLQLQWQISRRGVYVMALDQRFHLYDQKADAKP